jgi:hypothetical protein
MKDDPVLIFITEKRKYGEIKSAFHNSQFRIYNKFTFPVKCDIEEEWKWEPM